MPQGFPKGIVLKDNCTTDVLDAGESFTGKWVNVEEYVSVVCAAKSDASGTMYIDFVHIFDGSIPSSATSPDSSLPYAVEGGISEPPHQLTISRGWMRVRYLNGSSNQTTFHLHTVVGAHGPIVSPANLSMAQNADALVARTIESEIDIAEGKRRGYAIVNKFGRNQDIDTGSEEDVWEGGGVYPGFPTGSGELITASSSSANDTSAGSGARTIKIFGLDDNGLEQNETITLNGASLVDSVNSYTRVNRIVVLTSGSSNSAFNDGIITIAHKTTTANIFGKVPIGANQSQIACYTIPAGKTGYLRYLHASIKRSNSATADGDLWIREDGASPRTVRIFSLSQTSSLKDTIFGGIRLPALTDLSLRISSVSSNNTGVTGGFDIILVDN